MRMPRARASLTVLLSLAILIVSIRTVGAAIRQPARDYSTFDVCKVIPGEAVARALGGKLVTIRATMDKTFSRCTYFVVLPGNEKQTGYVVWMQPAEDFEELKKAIEEPMAALSGLGDGAYMFQDKGDGRFKINVLKRGDLMFQATGESKETARKVAEAVVAQLWKKVL